MTNEDTKPFEGTFYLVFGEYGICHVVYYSKPYVERKQSNELYPKTVCGKSTMTAMYCSYNKKDLDGYGVCKICFKNADYCEQHNFIAYDYFTIWDHAIREHISLRKDR